MSPLRARRPGRAARPPTWWRRAVRRRGRLCARGSRSRPGLLAAAAAAVTTGRSREQRFPPQRSAASDRPYTARELSPAPLPASVAPSPPPPSVASYPASAQRLPQPGPRAVRLGGAARVGGCPDGGVPRESQPALSCGPEDLQKWRGKGVGGPGNPGLWKSQTRASVFSSVKREGWTSRRCLRTLAFVIFQVPRLKKVNEFACVYVGWGHSFCDFRGKALGRGKTGDSSEASQLTPGPHLPSSHYSHLRALIFCS